ncbi:protein eiger isoform X2 [Musca domestica]|uniref:Protein eiger isoform X2 n=1 Tax=Musca domestica TaxID=7370 RepID=A0A9J7IGK0_MUSDO|nr:protein eiger isoform X2 [Musca domestica]
MTAETLKPFITPGSVDYVTTSHSSASSVHSRSSRCFLAIAASALVVVLITSLLGLTIWHTVRISNLQTEVGNLNKVIESMQKRLGLTYLDDLSDLEKEDENNNALIDDMLPDDDEDDDDGDDDNDSESNSGEEDDDEDDDADYTYDELLKKYSDYEVDNEDDDDDNGNNSRTNDDDDDDLFDDDDLYDDFEKFVESTKETPQRKRKTRSVSMLKDATDEVPLDTSRSKMQRSHKSLVAAENAERRRSPMRLYSSRRRKFPMIKSDKHLISAKTIETINALNEVETSKPAVHFHLTHKIPNHPSVRVTSYTGDVYIGKPTWTNERESLDTYFHVENGVLTVHEPGLYYVYAQICYHNHHNQNGFVIFHGHKPFLQCLSHIFTNNHSVFNTCHTSGLIYLKRDEQIHIQDFHTDRKTHLQEENNRSYFGLIKI